MCCGNFWRRKNKNAKWTTITTTMLKDIPFAPMSLQNCLWREKKRSNNYVSKVFVYCARQCLSTSCRIEFPFWQVLLRDWHVACYSGYDNFSIKTTESYPNLCCYSPQSDDNNSHYAIPLLFSHSIYIHVLDLRVLLLLFIVFTTLLCSIYSRSFAAYQAIPSGIVISWKLILFCCLLMTLKYPHGNFIFYYTNGQFAIVWFWKINDNNDDNGLPIYNRKYNLR